MTFRSSHPFLQTATWRYAAAGAAFGLVFPVVATLISILEAQLPLSLASVIAVQRTQPLLWIIDTAPIFLGLFASLAGRREDRLTRTNALLRELAAQLQEQQEDEARKLMERTVQLNTGADVARDVAAILDTNQLLREVVNLITERFGFYYAAVFTLDDTGRWAVLREATGEAGRVLKERRHRLEVGGQSMVGTATKTRRPRIALDVGSEAVRFANPLLPDTRSEIALPLVVGSRVLGALDVQSTQRAAFDESSAVLLQAMADQIAISLSNTFQFKRAQVALQSMRHMVEASRAVLEAPDMPTMLEVVVTHAVPRATWGHLILFGPQTLAGEWSYLEYGADWVRPQSESSPLPVTAGTRVTTAQLPFVRIMNFDQPTIISDVNTDQIDDDVRRSLQQSGAVGVLGIPLNAGKQPLGLLVFGFGELQGFDSTRLEPLTTLANQVAIAIQNQRSLAETQAALQQLNEVNRRLTRQAWREYTQPAGGVLRRTDTGADVPTVTDDRLPSSLSAPVKLRGEVIGVLSLEDATADRKWTPNEIALLQAVANEVSMAVENARLIEETEKRAQRERLVSDISSRMFAANDLETIVQIAGEELSRILRVSRTEVTVESAFAELAIATAVRSKQA
jgi:GAF domain-containing protein